MSVDLPSSTEPAVVNLRVEMLGMELGPRLRGDVGC